MKIYNLQTCHLCEPIGYQFVHAVFSWNVSQTDAEKQRWACVEVFTDRKMQQLLWSSGKCETLSNLSCECPVVLKPRTRYTWRVTVMADNGEIADASSWFETGKMDEPWQAQWIEAPFSNETHPLFRKHFSATGAVRRARLYITGLGLYEASLNKQRVGDEYLTPYCNDYHLWIQAQTFDVTALLKSGENTLDVMLGNGWYRGRMGFDGGAEELFGERMKLLAELIIDMADGSRVVIASDKSWQCMPAPVLFSGIYDGEVYNAQLETQSLSAGEETEFVPVQYAAAPDAALYDRLSLPVRIMERRNKKEILHTPKGETVLDFGQIISGWVEFDCEKPDGAQVALLYGELLQDGCFYQENLRTAKQAFTFISDGKPHHVRPHFTFYGFRYVKVTGLSDAELQSMTAMVIHSDIRKTGTLTTSNEKVNRLIANSEWSQLDNFVDVPTDCPQRDERLGWTGDAEVYCATACFNRDSAAFYRKYLQDMYLEQSVRAGCVPHVVPDIICLVCEKKGLPTDGNSGSCAWADAAVIIPWTLYVFYGDLCLLREQYRNMRGWTEYLFREDEAHGAPRLRLWDFHFADWLALDNPDKESCFGATDAFYVASAYYYWSVHLTAKAAAALGYAEDQQRYEKLAEEIRSAIQQEYFTPTGRLAIPTQTGMALALAMDLVSERFRARLVTDLAQKLDHDGGFLMTGFVGTYFLCAALAENGLADRAYDLLLNEKMPGWLYEVNMGATTIWERWNSILPDGHVSDTGMNSMNHYAYGAIVEWMYRYMCGLHPSEQAPGFRQLTIRPMPSRRFASVQAQYESASGTIRSGWNWNGNRISFHVELPFGVCAEFILPQGCHLCDADPHAQMTENTLHLRSGSYVFSAIAGENAMR